MIASESLIAGGWGVPADAVLDLATALLDPMGAQPVVLRGLFLGGDSESGGVQVRVNVSTPFGDVSLCASSNSTLHGDGAVSCVTRSTGALLRDSLGLETDALTMAVVERAVTASAAMPASNAALAEAWAAAALGLSVGADDAASAAALWVSLRTSTRAPMGVRLPTRVRVNSSGLDWYPGSNGTVEGLTGALSVSAMLGDRLVLPVQLSAELLVGSGGHSGRV